ncbi:methionine--tRNA ligase [Candidatus Undinarchaeota archaeon]
MSIKVVKVKKFYVTTPIYYVNDVPHLGHGYTTIAADVLARWHRQRGEDVVFLTGTDEHGQKVENAARKKGVEPREFVDKLVPVFKENWELLNISNDDFIRTTDERHEKIVKEIIKTCEKNGDIYKGEYEGLYCIPCESYWTELQLVNGNCPECGRPVELLKEDAYFFKLSKYENQLLEFYEKNPDFLAPEFRGREIIARVKEGLKDLSITRKSFKWGIEFPLDKEHVVYVWFDALTNYISALGWPDGKFKDFWPANVHLIGKEINWFHSVIWPAMLFSAGIEPPKKVFAHGWLTVDGEKMSKSKGNFIQPKELIEKYGVDAFRYFLIREISFGEDGDFSEQALVNRLNSDLADELGNLVSRVAAMIGKYADGKVPEGKLDPKLKKKAEDAWKKAEGHIDNIELNKATEVVWSFLKELNRYVNEKEPWVLAKNKDKELDNVLYNLAEGLRVASGLVFPFIPESAEKIAGQFGIAVPTFDELKWGDLKPGTELKKGEILFEKKEFEEKEAEFSGKKVVVDDEIKKSDLSVCIGELTGIKVTRKNAELRKMIEKGIKEIDFEKAGKVIDGYRYLIDEGRDKDPAGLSSENLINFIKKGSLPNINVVTDAYNLISARTGMIMGVYDARGIEGDVHLKVTDGSESFFSIGSKKREEIYPGEYVLADDANNVITKWLSKQSEKIKIGKATKNAIVCVQGNKELKKEEVEKILTEVCELITKLCGGKWKILYKQ